MNMLKFPKIFYNNSTAVESDAAKCTLEALYLLINCEAGTLHGDPEYGIHLRKYFYDQNNYVLRDILIDELYVKICTFCPWVFLERKNIKITQEDLTLKAKISCKNKETFETYMYDLILFSSEEANV